MAMARELVNEESIGQSADAIWRNLRRQQEQLPPGGASAPEKLRAACPANPFSEGTLAKEPEPFPATALGSGQVTQLALFEHFRVVKDRNQSAKPAIPVLKLEKEASHERKGVIRSKSAR
jgi:hypothetical protein